MEIVDNPFPEETDSQFNVISGLDPINQSICQRCTTIDSMGPKKEKQVKQEKSLRSFFFTVAPVACHRFRQKTEDLYIYLTICFLAPPWHPQPWRICPQLSHSKWLSPGPVMSSVCSLRFKFKLLTTIYHFALTVKKIITSLSKFSPDEVWSSKVYRINLR